MPHIHTETGQHDLTASGFIYKKIQGQDLYRLLLHKHKKLGLYMQPGGHVELLESPWSAVIHELLEETGYSQSQLSVLQPNIKIAQLDNAIVHPQPVCVNTHRFNDTFVHFHTDLTYAFIVDGEPDNNIAEGESSDFIEVSLEELRALPLEAVHPNIRQLGVQIFETILNEWQAIPATEYSTASH